MALKKTSLDSKIKEVQAAQARLEQLKKEQKLLEDGIKQEIGTAYVKLMLLEDSSLSLEEVLAFVKEELKEKEKSIKAKKKEIL